MTKTVGSKLIIDEFIDLHCRQCGIRTYWDCQKVRAGECTASAIPAAAATEEGIVVIRGPVKWSHTHPPSQKQCKAEEVLTWEKRKAEEHPEQPPAELLCNELADVPVEVLSHLPKWGAMRQSSRHTRRHNMPANPRMLEKLEDIPDQYQGTLQGEWFLMFDSYQMDCDSKKYWIAAQK